MAGAVAVINVTSVSTGGTLAIQPASSGVIWLIQNITWAGPITLERATSALSGVFQTETAAGSLQGTSFRVDSAKYLKITNTSTASNVCGYDGVIWPES